MTALCTALVLAPPLTAHAQPAAQPAVQPPAQASAPPAPRPTSPAYLLELQRRAKESLLAERRMWRRLAHYQADLWGGGYTSQADGPGFFLSPQGKTDPAAELAATLAAFFSAAPLEPGKMTAQCTFPARYRWLKERLNFDPARLPEQPCERFAAWRAALEPESITLIFASFYLNNPSSIFGHTLLRFDKRGRPDSQRLLDYAVNYAAAVPPDDGAVVFAWRGIFGGYNGYFSVLPYYLKVREYSDLESRDLWEYKLALTDDQLDWLVRHTWEMGSTFYTYYFAGENCSYHLLSLLEVARQDLVLLAEFPAWTLPTDTVRAVAGQPGLVAGVTYRPSRGSRMHQKLNAQTPEEQALSIGLARGGMTAETPLVAALPPSSRALVIDTAIDYLQYRMADQAQPPQEQKDALRALLLARSALGSPYDPDAFPRQSQPPETGHASSRVLAGVGGSTAVPQFAQVSAYTAFHDLLSREDGYAPNSQMKLANLQARVEAEQGQYDLRLERAALVDVMSLFTTSALLRQPSWRVAFGWQRNRDLGCDYCVPFFLEGGIGLAAESRWLTRTVGFAMLEASAEYDRAFEHGHRAGLGLSAGVLVDLSSEWRAALLGSRMAYTTGDAALVTRWSFQQRYTLASDWELRADWSGVETYREAHVGLGWFF